MAESPTPNTEPQKNGAGQHWMRTPEGKARLSAAMKLAHKRKPNWLSPAGRETKKRKAQAAAGTTDRDLRPYWRAAKAAQRRKEGIIPRVAKRQYRRKPALATEPRTEAQMNSAALFYLERYMARRGSVKPTVAEMDILHAYFTLRGEE